MHFCIISASLQQTTTVQPGRSSGTCPILLPRNKPRAEDAYTMCRQKSIREILQMTLGQIVLCLNTIVFLGIARTRIVAIENLMCHEDSSLAVTTLSDVLHLATKMSNTDERISDAKRRHLGRGILSL